MKALLAGAALLASSSLMAAPISYFACDFEDGFPEGTAVYDRDGQTLNFAMVNAGFDETDSWRLLGQWSELYTNHYAASASKHKTTPGVTASAADDWMVLPAVWIRSDEATLSWKGQSINDAGSVGSSYKVYVSDTGNAPEDFTGDPVAEVNEESVNYWSKRSTTLRGFAGKRVYIAFVNCSYQKEILAIDDIDVSGEPGLAEVSVTPEGYALGENGVAVSVTVTATSDQPVTRVAFTCVSGGNTLTLQRDDVKISNGQSMTFTFPEKIKCEWGETVSYTLSSVINGVDFDPISKEAVVLAFLPHKRVVAEEATGMWCQYCPGGIVAIDQAKEAHPDQFIPIAVHVGASSGDKLAMDDYGLTFPGAPTAWVDRIDMVDYPVVSVKIGGKETYTAQAGGLLTHVDARLAQVPYVDVTVGSSVSGSTVSVNGDCRYAINYSKANHAMVYVLTQDGMWQDGYFQYNGYSGYEATIGGFEKLPKVITSDFQFDHVARAIADGSKLPSTIEATRSYAHSGTLTIPAGSSASDKLNVVALLIDKATGEVLNAATSPLGESGIEDVAAEEVKIVVNSEAISAEGAQLMALYGMDGRLVRTGTTFIPVSGLKGIFVLSVDGKTSRKIRL